jgi:hypothetical protein
MTQEPTGSRKHGVAATEIVVDALNTGEIGQAISVMSRGMRDNPLHVVAFGIDPDARLKKLQRLFTIVMTTDKFKQYALVARDADGDIVGVCGMSPPGDCTPTTGEQLRVLPRMLPLGPRPLVRVMQWMAAWAKHDPKQRHWHLGPVAVAADVQG